jgi:hypothetical protein
MSVSPTLDTAKRPFIDPVRTAWQLSIRYSIFSRGANTSPASAAGLARQFMRGDKSKKAR